MISDTINDDVTMVGGEKTLLANRYRIIKQLGQGGMGSVWLAEDTELDDRQVAIKMLPSILLSNKRAYKQIKSEALVSLKLTHPNIATLRSFVENNGNPFLVIDYIKGRPLDDYLAERGSLTEQEAVALLSPIAAALDYAHARNVIHRDVKPSNVMIADDGTPYILDFGVAREMQDATTSVTGKLPSGTLKYMSPEQLHGAAPKAAQDIYSFAAMVYECLTGAPPFARGQIEYQIEHDTPPPLPEGFSIAKQVMAGLAKKPEDRPSTCILILAGPESTRVSSTAGVAPCLERKMVVAIAILVAVAFLALLIGGICHVRSTPIAESEEHGALQPNIEAEPSGVIEPPPAVNKDFLKKFHAQQGEDPKVEYLTRQLKAVEMRRDVATEGDSQLEQLVREHDKESTANKLKKMMRK